MMSLKRWLLVAFVAVVIFGIVVAAQDDDDDDEPIGETVDGQAIDDVMDGIDAEDAADDLDAEMDGKDEDSIGIKAASYFTKYGDMKVPAGERVEILVPISNADGNPSYEVALVAGNLATLDHSRFLQNFSAQVYDRKLEGGETATVKYTVTPDALIEPMEYAFVVAAYLKTDDNNTLMVSAYNGTITITDPEGFDFKGTLTMIGFFGAIGAAVYWYTTKNQKAAAPRKAAPVETGTKAASIADVDASFLSAEHQKLLDKKKVRGRSASPKK